MPNPTHGGEFMHIICAQIVNSHKPREPAKMSALSARITSAGWRRIMKEQEKQGWAVVAVLFATLFLIWGPVNAGSVFFLPVVKHFGWSRALFSLLVATAPLAAGFSSPAIGSIMDRYGERRIMIAGATMVALSFIALSRADSAAAFFAIFVVLGVGISASTIIPSALVITSWFRERRGLALGIAFAGIPLGGTGITILASYIVQKSGFRTGYFAMAIPILLVVIPLLALFMRTPPEKEKVGAVGGAMVAELPGLEVGEALRSRSFWMLAIAEVLFATAGVGLRVHLVPFLTGIGYSPRLAAEILGAMFLFSAIGSFGMGALADRLGGRATLSIVFFAGAAGIAALLGASHLIAVAAFVVVFGLVRETHIVPIVITESLGAKRLGTFLGILALFTTFGFAAGPVIAGRIFDRTGSYTGALLLFAVLGIVSMLAMRATLPLAEEKARIENGEAGTAEPAVSR
jgi:MFS family permease